MCRDHLPIGIFLSKVLLQQAATGLYEELNYRYLLLNGMEYSNNGLGLKMFFTLGSAVLFGLLHCVTGWNTYTFLQTGAIGFAFAVSEKQYFKMPETLFQECGFCDTVNNDEADTEAESGHGGGTGRCE